MQHYDVAVVGLGALGSSAAYHVARRGKTVIGLEQFALGHVRGASHDSSRIVRRSYHAPEYVRLADSAYRDWDDLEQATGQHLLTRTGGVTLCPPGAAFGAADYARSMSAHDVPFEVLDAAELRTRWPQFRVGPQVLALSQDDSGMVHAGRTTALLQDSARALGAVLQEHCPVTALEPTSAGVVVHAASGAVHADVVVVCADAWTNRLLAPLGAALPLVSTLEQVSYFAPELPADYAPGRFPVWIWDDDPCFYGFPTYGEPTIKAARDSSGIELDVDRRSFEPVPERLAELREVLGNLLPSKGRHVRTVTCQYTLTPDRGFALGPVPGHPDLLVALGAGHAFKFTPTIGRVLAELALTGRTTDDIGAFALDRAAMVAPSAGYAFAAASA